MLAARRTKSSPSLDPFDLAILAVLQRDNRTPHHEIGIQVHLSPAAVRRRIRRLEAEGVIKANTAILDPAKVGRPITIIVGVQIDSERADLLDATRNALASAPEVQQCYYVTGDVDFFLVVTASDMSEYEEISGRLFRQNRNIKRFSTYVAMKCVKSTLSVPLAG